jgi:hypothetical protein
MGDKGKKLGKEKGIINFDIQCPTSQPKLEDSIIYLRSLLPFILNPQDFTGANVY